MYAHLSEGDALLLLSGSLSGTSLALTVPHWVESCPVCLRVWQEVQEEMALHASASGEPPRSPLDRALTDHRESLSPRQSENWKRELRQLLQASPARRLAMITGASRRYKSPLTAWELLERSRAAMPEEPSEAEHFARLSYAVASRNVESARLGLEALTCMHLANAARARGDLRTADGIVDQARFHARHSAVTDPVVLAELDELEALLRQNQNRFEEAAFLFAGAVSRYRRYAKWGRLSQTLMSLANVQAFEGDPLTAIATLREALELIVPEADPKLYLYARHNLVFYLCDAGEHAEARRLFDENRPLYGHPPDRWLALRMAWVEARIARAHGELTDAERHLRQIAAAFARMGNGYDAALASLDLAEVLVAAGQTGKLRAMVRGVAVILRSEDLHREATAAILLFQKALADELVTRNLLDHVRSYLEAARNNPALRFDPSA